MAEIVKNGKKTIINNINEKFKYLDKLEIFL